MKYIDLQSDMKNQLATKDLLEQAKAYAYDYIENLPEMDVYPSDETISKLEIFDEPLAEASSSPSEIIDMLYKYGSKATSAQSGGKYFGFVCGGILPVALATKWLSDTWDQNSALFVYCVETFIISCEKAGQSL